MSQIVRLVAPFCLAVLVAGPLRAQDEGGGFSDSWSDSSSDSSGSDGNGSSGFEREPSERPSPSLRRRPATGPVDESADDGEEAEFVRLRRPKKRKVVTEQEAAEQQQSERQQSERQQSERQQSERQQSERQQPNQKRPEPASQQGTRRIQLFLVPVGDSAGLAAGPAQMALESELAKLPGFKPVDMVEALAATPSAEQVARFEEARRIITDGNKLMASRAYEDAAARFRRALESVEAAGFAADAQDYADCWARIGIAQALAGDDGRSRESLQMAARFDQGALIDGRRIDKRQGQLLDQAREAIAQGTSGALSVVTQPAGARVFVGGVYRGTSPVTVSRLPTGINLVKIDRPGGVPVIQQIDVQEGMDTPLRVKTKFTQEAIDIQRALLQVPRALSNEAGIPDALKGLGIRFNLERAVFATVEGTKSNQAAVRVVVVDFPRNARLVDEKQSFTVDVEGGLDKPIAKWAVGVFDRADKSRNRAAADPLSRTDGTEQWYDGRAQKPGAAKPQGYKPTGTRKADVKSKDPLDHMDGTEEW